MEIPVRVFFVGEEPSFSPFWNYENTKFNLIDSLTPISDEETGVKNLVTSFFYLRLPICSWCGH